MMGDAVQGPDRLAEGLRWLLAAALAISLGYYVVFSWHWPILRDTSIMHYVTFLMDHGMQPYREITDNNLPGAYLAERLGMAVFGRGDLAWRVCDWVVLAAITGAMVVIARPYDWMAGVFGGGMFALLHGSEGPDFPMEREEVVTALLLVGFALLFTAMRRRQAWWVGLFGFCAGASASIKPTTAPFGLLVLGLAAWVLWRRGERPLPYVVWGVGGMAAAGAVVLAFLLRYDAIGPLLFVLRQIMPSYVSMSNKGLGELLRMMMPRNLLLPAGLGVVLAVLRRREWTAERWLLLAAVCFGAVSFVAQRKGSIYHRYPFVAFLLLVLGLELLTALRARGRWERGLGAAGVLAVLTISVPHYLVQLRTSPGKSTMPFALALTEDLRAMGAKENLQRQVECLDLTYGCFSALYHLGLVENNGFTGDLLLFAPGDSRAARYYRDCFWADMHAHPPAVLVMSNEWFPYQVSFRKLEAWPEFAAYVRENYREVMARSFPPDGHPAPGVADPDSRVPGYRIYVRKGE